MQFACVFEGGSNCTRFVRQPPIKGALAQFFIQYSVAVPRV
jgi:hypothetical protein